MIDLFEKYHHLRKPGHGGPTNGEPELFLHTRTRSVLDALARGQIAQHKSGRQTGAQLASAMTICILEGGDGNEVARGYAFCGDQEQFCRATGRKIALGRALSDYADSVTV